MDTFSSFLSSIPKRNLSIIPTKSPSASPQFNISCVSTQDKPDISLNSSSKSSISTTLPKSSEPETHSSSKTKPTYIRKSKPQSTPLNPSLSSALLNAFDNLINTFIDPPTKQSIDPKFNLSDNFAPVDELPPTQCQDIEGVLPSCINGAYIRNGPNPQFLPQGPYHLFEGDGMLHSLRILDGKATLCSRYVKTYKYMLEGEIGANIFPNVFSGFNSIVSSAARGALAVARFITGQYSPSNGMGSANTSLTYFAKRLFALYEADLPYEIRLTPNGDIQTVGRTDFDGKLFMSMTAHPKIDLDTAEAFAFRYSPIPPFVTFFRFDPNGNKQPDVPIFSMIRPSFLHDFAITKKYAVFPDIQIGMDPIGLMKGGSPMGLDPGKLSRIGVIPRYAMDEKDMRWFEVPGLNTIHIINAWDEVDKDGNEAVVVVAPNLLSAEHTLERMELAHALIEKVRIDLKTGIVSRQPLSARNLEFSVLNPAYTGKKNRYVYAAVGEPMPKIIGVAKLDLSLASDRRDCIIASRIYGPGCYGGEPFFVARDPDDADADEDDGYILSYIHDENSGESRFVVMDAKTPDLDIVASVKLPQRVPYGFHGLFVRDKDIKGM